MLTRSLQLALGFTLQPTALASESELVSQTRAMPEASVRERGIFLHARGCKFAVSYVTCKFAVSIVSYVTCKFAVSIVSYVTLTHSLQLTHNLQLA